MSVSYLPLGTVGRKRVVHLREQYGFDCSCERCRAPAGSHLYERERWEFALVCSGGRGPACGAEAGGVGASGGVGGSPCQPTMHALLPDDPYDDHSSYRCAAPGCGASLPSDAAKERLRGVLQSFVSLHAQVIASDCGCF